MRPSKILPNNVPFVKHKRDIDFNFSKEYYHLFSDLNKRESDRQAALELIAFQNDGFFEKVTEWFKTNFYDPLEKVKVEESQEGWDSLNRKVKALVKKNDLENKFNEMILDRLGIRLDTKFWDLGPFAFACLPPNLNVKPVMNRADSVLLEKIRPELARDAMKDYIKQGIGKIKGRVDLKRAQLDGFYSTITAGLFMDVAGGVMYLSPEEFTAVCFHELGHIFFSMEFAFRTQYACQVLAHLHQVKTNRDSQKTYDQEVQLCLETLKEGGVIHGDVELETEVQAKDDKVIQTLVLVHTWAKLSYDYGNDRSAAPNFEILADNFAIRFGAGQYLASALNLFGVHGIPKNDALSYYEGVFMSVVWGTMFGFIFAGTAPFNLAAFAGMGLFVLISKFLLGGEHKTGTILPGIARYKNEYDDGHTRITKIKEGLIRQLKEGHLNESQKKVVVHQLDDVNRSLKDYKKKEDLLDDLANFVFKERRLTVQFMKTQRELEKLSDNELFIGSQKLQSL